MRQAVWYRKARPTFSDTLAFVRKQFWSGTLSEKQPGSGSVSHLVEWCMRQGALFWTSPAEADMVNIPKSLLARLTDALAYAA